MAGFVSLAQRDKWREMVDEGKVTKAQYDARAEETDESTLPERATPRRRTVGASRSADMARPNDRRY